MLDAAFWRSIDGMHCCDDAWLEREATRLRPATTCSDDELAREGATTIAGDERCAALARRCASAVEALAELRLPAVFVFMFDEVWALVRAHELAVATQLPRNAKLNYDVYAWRVSYGSRGWAAHRDRDRCPTVDGKPCYATVWIALTDVRRDTSCIWYAPLSQTLHASDDPLSLQRASEPVAEPLPVKPGDAALWSGSTVHFGGAHTNSTHGSRISLAFAVSTPQMQDDEERVSAVHACSRAQRPAAASTAQRCSAFGAGWRNRVAIEPEPVGSGVVAQVHRGVYEAARRREARAPGARRAVSEDLAVLAFLARAADGLAPSIAKFLDPVGLVDDFSEKMGRSSSMEFEADALRKLRKNFSREAGVAIPEPRLAVFLARRGALVESLEDGLPLAECLRALEGAPEAKAAKRAIAARGLRALLKMLFVDNCVHCDMHSGNLLVRPHGADVAASVARGAFDLVILDAGLTLELERRDLVNFVDLFAAVVRRDGRACGHLLLDRARYHECDDREAFAADVDRLIKAATVRLEAKFATTVVAITIVEGIGRNLDPDLDLLREAAPFLLSRAALKAI
ncbi:kinase [Aureococcus anophagefferens]|nr:kinase [Aureococcus anophagefferens]